MSKKIVFALLAIVICRNFAFAQQSLYDVNTIQKIEIFFTENDWDHRLDTAKLGADGYIMAKTVKINGVSFDSVGVKYKGNSSFDSTYRKNPFNISLDEYKSQTYQGYKTLKLANCFADPSMIREILSYDIAKNYLDCPKANYAQIFVNDDYIGLYANVESINKQFCSDRFSSSSNTLISCSPIVKPTPNTKSNLRYIVGADSTGYKNFYEIKSTYGWNDLVALCDSVTNHAENIASVMDMGRVIWMLAFNNVMVNLDSYSGVFCQNYYLYKDKNQRFIPIIWDLNMSLGGLPFAGSSNSSLGSLTVANMQQLPLALHASDQYWPLINIVMNNPTYKRMYVAHARTILAEMFTNNTYKSKASALQALIDTAVKSDNNKFFTYDQFTAGMTTNTSYSSYIIPGIEVLMNARISYLRSTAEFSAAQPVISDIKPSVFVPKLNSTVSITAKITNANSSSVWLAVRFNNTGIFTKIPMLDDGAHNDGAANDNVFGATFSMNSFQAQYYIYAENANAGVFSPERAEHEFHLLNGVAASVLPGQVVINEFLALNNTDSVSEKGTHEDWIELYNTTSTPLSLLGLYISDNIAKPTKFAFPENAVIQPKSFLRLWADEDSVSKQDIHCSFKLSGSGEQLIISDGGTLVIDSLTFGAQSPDISMGRCPDGTGAFFALTKTSFGSANKCGVLEVSEYSSTPSMSIFPNPSDGFLHISLSGMTKEMPIIIRNSLGQIIFTESAQSSKTVDVSAWASGIYFMQFGNTMQKIVVLH